tara:strand:- start:268 stop:561 length:294 start_codon:yes stop_codon:yes gene_type:complete
MAKNYQYIVAENWGKGFIELNESTEFEIKGFPGNVWSVPKNNKKANLWISKVLGTIKTKDEAQTIVNAEIQSQQNIWDAALPETRQEVRPINIILEE